MLLNRLLVFGVVEFVFVLLKRFVEVGVVDVVGVVDDEDVVVLLLNRLLFVGVEVVGVVVGFVFLKREVLVFVLGVWVVGVEELLVVELLNKFLFVGVVEVVGLVFFLKRLLDVGVLLKRLGLDVVVVVG